MRSLNHGLLLFCLSIVNTSPTCFVADLNQKKKKIKMANEQSQKLLGPTPPPLPPLPKKKKKKKKKTTKTLIFFHHSSFENVSFLKKKKKIFHRRRFIFLFSHCQTDNLFSHKIASQADLGMFACNSLDVILACTICCRARGSQWKDEAAEKTEMAPAQN